MPETGIAEAELACERLRAAIARHESDSTLYTAKADGRNLVRLAA